MKPSIVCENFEPPTNLTLFMNDAIGEILRISPYESHLEARIKKEAADYVMSISIHYADGKFLTSVRNADLKHIITEATANIFTQVRAWWKSRFEKDKVETKMEDISPQPLYEAFHSQTKQKDLTHPPKLKKPLRVLVVDDDMESVNPLELCLEKLGCSAFVVNNGFEAIHEIVSHDRIYDVIILDWNMPEMNGGQALLNAQQVITHRPDSTHHWENSKLPVITYSSRAREEIEVPECRDFRHLDHWEKPSSYIHLLNQMFETFSKL